MARLENEPLIPASLAQAKADSRVRGAPLAILIWCHENLDPFDFRDVKVLAVARACHLKEWTTSRGLRQLSTAGYIRPRRRKARNRAAQYRLSTPKPQV